MSPELIKVVATIVSGALLALARADVYPELSSAFDALAGVLAGWTHLRRPGDVGIIRR